MCVDCTSLLETRRETDKCLAINIKPERNGCGRTRRFGIHDNERRFSPSRNCDKRVLFFFLNKSRIDILERFTAWKAFSRSIKNQEVKRSRMSMRLLLRKKYHTRLSQ